MDKRRVIVGCNNTDSASIELAGNICGVLRGAGMLPCSFPEGGFRSLEGTEELTSADGCLCVVTVGGDGTILRLGKRAARLGLPLLGVNTGRLGFMATLEPSEIERIPAVITGERPESIRMMMNVVIERADGSAEEKLALNDVVISREAGSKLPEFCICSGSSEVSRIRADGVILSTPTGSTAYSLSAGGPIIAPDMECIEFTALCPHTLFARPMIFSARQTVSVKYNAYQGSSVNVSVDGQHDIRFGDGDVLRLRRSELSLRLIEAGGGFYSAVHNKLMTPLK